MRAGIIGLPMVGKTTLFKILTKADIKVADFSNQKGVSPFGISRVPDSRLDQLTLLFQPKKTTPAVIEYVDIGALARGKHTQDLNLENVRTVDVLVNVVRAFDTPVLPPKQDNINPRMKIGELDFELILRDLFIIEKRLERVEKDLKKMKTLDLHHEKSLLEKCQEWLELDRPLRSLELTSEEKKRIRGFTFLSEKPVLHVLNLPDSEASQLAGLTEAYQLQPIVDQPNVEATGVCGKLEAEMAELSDEEAFAFLEDYGLSESGLVRLINVTYRLLGLMSFFTVGKDECRAWTIQRGTPALKAAGTIHSDIERCFIRAEVIPWNLLLEMRSLSAARAQGLLRLEGKEYVVQDGDTINFRHSA